MEELTIEQAWLDAAQAKGACADAMKSYRAGMLLSSVSQSHLVWCEEVLPELSAAISERAGLPLWALGSGYGYGSGSGSGYGYGYGDGDGSGYGSGSGSGSGYGYGYGDGA